jgi:penicillin-binding protein 1A
VDRQFAKSQILETYLNRIYLGDGYFGVQAAARGYFGKDASALTATESAMLAGIIRCPSSCSPRLHPARAKARRDLVLRAMAETGAISANESAEARALPIAVQPRSDSMQPEGRLDAGDVGGLYFVAAVRRQLVQRFGEDLVLRGGLKVFTTIDLPLQTAAEDAVVKRLDALNAREAKARKAATLDNPLEGSLVALDPKTGQVLALVGGRDFNESSFDRATMAKRQPGSAFKPIFFAAALEQGYAPSAVVDDLDVPIAASDGAWLPGGDHEMESYTLREALTVSSNRAAAQLLQRVGVQNAIYYAHRLGITAPLPAVPSLALGTGEVTLLELTAAYGVFANNGLLAPCTMITTVADASGEVLWQAHDTAVQAIQPETAFLMSSMLADVVNRGTGAGVRSAGFRLPAGGKTGTTDSYSDAWFIGYTPNIVTGVWFGRDMPDEIMQRGYAATVAVPAWVAFMKQATAGQKSQWFTPPSTLQRVAICEITGMLATDDCRAAAENGEGAIVEDYYRRGQPRPEPCTYHSEFTAADAARVAPAPSLSTATAAAKRPLIPVAVFGPGWSSEQRP